MRDFLFHLSPKSGGGLQSQIRHLVVDAILEGPIEVNDDQIEARREFLAGYGRTESERGLVDDAAMWIERIVAGEEPPRPERTEHPMPAGVRD